jgi:hypothetical protein
MYKDIYIYIRLLERRAPMSGRTEYVYVVYCKDTYIYIYIYIYMASRAEGANEWHDRAKSSKVTALEYLLCKPTIRRTFENFERSAQMSGRTEILKRL